MKSAGVAHSVSGELFVDLFSQAFESRRYLDRISLGRDRKRFKMVGKRRLLSDAPLADGLECFDRIKLLFVSHHRQNQGFTVVARIAYQRQQVIVETMIRSSATVNLFAPGPGRLAGR